MGRKLPALAPAGAAAAGRKRKGATLTTLAACKRPARAQVIGGWASLPTDIVGLITCRLLAGDGDGDVVDYIAFRAVCSGWRACTPTARDPTLRDPRLRPRGWVALCDGDAVRLDDACEIVFFHTRTARRLRVLLPELRQHRIVGFTDGLLILVHKRTTEVRVLHPFTRVVVDFPPLAPVYHAVVRRMKLLDMSAAICSSASSATSIAVVVWFLCTSVVLGADPGSDWAEEPLENSVVVAHAPYFADRLYSDFLLVESGGRMLLVVRHPAPGDRSLFLSGDRCLSVSARDLPTLSSNSIYFSLPWDPIVLHSLGTGLSERLAESCKIHDGKDRIRPSVRPFTIADHLMTYCHTPEWSKGLMFHEYQHIPESFKELIKNIRAQDAQVRIPRIG
ncbi:hypothetical protein CFC21_041791 [Triticum aestivum]|uniref:Uncharacterized protein n=2 Tax=Triticum aestivum TaxID=4565 RepID=A0A3B6FNP8_WHEAT|nr:hypothetical protein CFC21_041791 [Triticum aestivum]